MPGVKWKEEEGGGAEEKEKEKKTDQKIYKRRMREITLWDTRNTVIKTVKGSLQKKKKRKERKETDLPITISYAQLYTALPPIIYDILMLKN